MNYIPKLNYPAFILVSVNFFLENPEIDKQ
jgi:hypothetical protein